MPEPTQCVLDASVTIAWLLDQDGLGAVLSPFFVDVGLSVPWIWQAEVANVLLVMERQRKLDAATVTQRLRTLDTLDVAVEPEPPDRTIASLVQVARPHQLTSYDALYLELAVRRGCGLLSNDRNLREAASRSGVPLAWDPDAGLAP